MTTRFLGGCMVNKEYEEILSQPLVDYIVKSIVPPLGAEYDDPIFNTYGMSISGICDAWHWFTKDNITETAIRHGHKPIEEASELELWQIIALCEWYWEKQYRQWYKKANKKSRRLDKFIGDCERAYFGYDKGDYTEETVDRVLNSVNEILQRVYKDGNT